MSFRHVLLTAFAVLALGGAVPAFAQDDTSGGDDEEMTQEEYDAEIAAEEADDDADEAEWADEDDGDEGEGAYEPRGPTEPKM